MTSILSIINTSHLLGVLDYVVDWVNTVLSTILWALCDIIFILLDLFEMVFKMFAGTYEKGIRINEQEGVTGDIVLFLIQTDIVQQIFTSLAVLAVFLLIIFTIFAIVKNQYAEKQEPVSKIIGASFKAMWLYFLVPICTVVCLMVGNIILQAIDGATRATANGGSASDMLFMSAAYNANWLRDESPEKNREHLRDMIEGRKLRPSSRVKTALESYGVDIDDPDSADAVQSDHFDEIAQIIDDAFISGELGNTMSKWSFTNVWKFYYVGKISLITVWIGGGCLILAIGKMCWGLISRLFKMTLFYAISPVVLAVFPIQGDKAFSSWRGEMVKLGVLAYSSVGVLNIIYSILPAFSNIDVLGGNILGDISGRILKLLITIIAFNGAKDLIGTIGGWFGLSSAMAEGESAKKSASIKENEAVKFAQKASKKVASTFGGIKGGIKAAKDQDKKGFWGGVMGGLNAAAPGLFKSVTAEAFQKGKKEAGDTYKKIKTEDYWTGEQDKDKLAEYEGREITGKENKKLAELMKKLEGLNKGSPEYEAILNKIKASSSLAQIKVKEDEEQLEIRQAQNSEHSQVAAAFDGLKTAGEQVEALAEKILGRKATADEIEKLKHGDIKSLATGKDKARIKAQFENLGGAFAEANIEFENSQSKLASLMENDERVKALTEDEEYKGLADFARITLGTSGDKDSAWSKFAEAVDKRMGDIEKEAKAIREVKKKVGEDIVKFATAQVSGKTEEGKPIDPDDYKKIGKNAGK